MTTETKQEKPAPGTRHQEQTFLVGENVYLRTLEPGDEKYATSWRASVFPVSPESVEKWIKEELPKAGGSKRGHLAIVRKSDDVIVGGIHVRMGDEWFSCRSHVDPLFGEQGERWLAEALLLYADWQVNEHFTPSVITYLDTSTPLAIELLKQGGFAEAVRFREAVERNNKRYDQVELQMFNDAWLKRLGNPLEKQMERGGNGEITPVPTFPTPEGDPPKNAVMIGDRVYLRPQDKKDAKRDNEMDRLETEPEISIGRKLTSEAAWADFISTKADEDHPKAHWFSVCLRENDELIGSVGVMDIDWVNRTAETGSHFFGNGYRGKGYGTEAKQLLLEYVFQQMGLHMVRSTVNFSNPRSAAALRKQGYKESGHWGWLYIYQGGFGNMAAFDLLASEWRALPRAGE